MYNFITQNTKLLKSSSNYKKYYATNRYTTTGYGMPNCTAYTLGRVNQLCDINNLSYNNFNGFHGNADTWGKSGYLGQDWTKSNTPKLGAVAVWSQTGHDGHVAIVEQINNNGTINTSNSGWAGSSQVGNEDNSRWWWYANNIDVHNYGTYTFMYYLYPPYIDDEPGPGPGPTPPGPDAKKYKTKFNWLMLSRKKKYLHRRLNML